MTETYGPWFLYGLFYIILVWEQVWELSNHAALSAWLLLIITAGAMVGSFFYERRIWCRFLCPIGGMNGLFAKLAMTELRARKGVCTATCSTYGCIKVRDGAGGKGKASVFVFPRPYPPDPPPPPSLPLRATPPPSPPTAWRTRVAPSAPTRATLWTTGTASCAPTA